MCQLGTYSCCCCCCLRARTDGTASKVTRTSDTSAQRTCPSGAPAPSGAAPHLTAASAASACRAACSRCSSRGRQTWTTGWTGRPGCARQRHALAVAVRARAGNSACARMHMHGSKHTAPHAQQTRSHAHARQQTHKSTRARAAHLDDDAAVKHHDLRTHVQHVAARVALVAPPHAQVCVGQRR